MKNKVLTILTLTLALSNLGTVGASAIGQAQWKLINNNWYYYDSNGQMKTGWIYDKGNWYYCYSNGQMAKNTTIDGYYLNSNGAWTTNISSNSSSTGKDFTWELIKGTHDMRTDISSRVSDMELGKELTNYNVNITEETKENFEELSDNLAKSRIYIQEARNNCIGKIVDKKYRITNITFLSQTFPNSTGTVQEAQRKTIKESDLTKYNPTASYVYDQYLVFICGNARHNEWEAKRIVIEFEAV